MGMFNKNAISEKAQGEKDTLGGGGPRDSDIYPMTIKEFYTYESAKGATMLNMLFEDEQGKPYRERTCIISGDDKGNKTYYTNAQGEQIELPGFSLYKSIMAFVNAEDPLDPELGEAVVKVYDPEEQKEVEKEIDTSLVEAIDQKVYLGVRKIRENKTERNDDGEYIDLEEERFTNEIDKAFHYPSKLTVPEAMAEQDEPQFYDKWLKRNQGNVVDKYKDVNKGKAGRTKKRTASSASDEKSGAVKKKKMF